MRTLNDPSASNKWTYLSFHYARAEHRPFLSSIAMQGNSTTAYKGYM
jgi:hypothetical protein